MCFTESDRYYYHAMLSKPMKQLNKCVFLHCTSIQLLSITLLDKKEKRTLLLVEAVVSVIKLPRRRHTQFFFFCFKEFIQHITYIHETSVCTNNQTIAYKKIHDSLSNLTIMLLVRSIQFWLCREANDSEYYLHKNYGYTIAANV